MAMRRCIIFFLLMGCMTLVLKAADVYPKYMYKEGVGLHFNWVKGVKGRAYYNNGTSNCVLLLAWTLEDNDNYMTTSNDGWSLVSDNTYYGFFPYMAEHADLSNKVLPVTYKGQRQCGNDSTTHLGAFDYMTANNLITASSPVFTFSHLGCVVRLKYTAQRAMSVNAVTLTTEGDNFVTSAMVDVPEQVITPTEWSSVMTLSTESMEIEKGQTMVAYLMMYPSDLSGKIIRVRLQTEEGVFVERQVTGTALKAGRLYDIDFSNDNALMAVGAKGNIITNKLVADAAVNMQRCYAPDFILPVIDDDEWKVKEPLLGDVNVDGKVDIDDARLLIDYLVGKQGVEIELSVADVNNDSMISMADANNIVTISCSK